MDKFLSFRENLLQSSEITFDANITADYGEEYYTFQMHCVADKNGELSFRVLSPDSIQGIEGTITQSDGHLTFDDHVLLFKTQDQLRLSPVCVPWVFLRALRSGYIASCGNTNSGYLAVVDDTYNENNLSLEIEFIEDMPISVEIFWNQARVMSVEISNFQYVA
jgi:hypothetical protein